MDSDILLTISAGVITHQPSAGIWHCTSEANYIKSLGFWTSNGPFVLCTSSWHFCFPRTITGPLLLLLSVLEFWLAQNKLALFNSNSNWESIFLKKRKTKNEAQEGNSTMWGQYTLHIISGTWYAFSIAMTKLQGKHLSFSPEFIQNRPLSPNETTSQSCLLRLFCTEQSEIESTAGKATHLSYTFARVLLIKL